MLINDSLDDIKFLGILHIPESDLDTITAKHSIAGRKIYMFTCFPKDVSGEYLQNGSTHIIIGMEYDSASNGVQCSIGPSIKYRWKKSGKWGNWKTVSAS